VRFFQLWNEPNLAYEWSWRIPEPERFVDLLGLAATAARAANPEAVILFPSLSPTDGKEPRKAPMSELEYLDRVYRAGGARHFDIMSAQAYGLGQPPEENRYIRLRWSPRRPFSELDRPIDSRIDVSRVVMLREVMELHGDGGKAVWISEFGYNSAPESVPEPARSNWGPPVSEQQKGEYLVGQLERARREWPWVGVMNVWMLRYGGYREPDPNDPTPYFALVTRNFEPLPAYERLRQYAAKPWSAGAGAHAWSHPAVRQLGEGNWELRFTGSGLSFRGMRAPLTAQLDDGTPLVLTPRVEDHTPVVAATGLAYGDHVALVAGERPPEAFLVSRARPLAWLWTLAPALLIAGLTATAALALGALVERRGRSARRSPGA
jgi:polysaccharide biosynthesis protein PslG